MHFANQHNDIMPSLVCDGRGVWGTGSYGKKWYSSTGNRFFWSPVQAPTPTALNPVELSLIMRGNMAVEPANNKAISIGFVFITKSYWYLLGMGKYRDPTPIDKIAMILTDMTLALIHSYKQQLMCQEM